MTLRKTVITKESHSVVAQYQLRSEEEALAPSSIARDTETS